MTAPHFDAAATLDDMCDLTMVDEDWPRGDNPDLTPMRPFIPRRHALLAYLKKNLGSSRSWGGSVK